MLQLTKIFHFEMAHAITGYPGLCKNIHGHSYELHVGITSKDTNDDYLPSPGFIIDFKTIKAIVKKTVIEHFDHKLVLSHAFLDLHPGFPKPDNLLIYHWEPTAENILIFIRKELPLHLDKNMQLVQLKLFETKDSYAEWINDKTFTAK